MTIPSMSDIANMYRPLPLAVTELRINDQWLGRWSEADELPANAPVGYVYATLYSGDKGYLLRARGSQDVWEAVDGETGGEDPEAWLRREIPARSGLSIGQLVLIGFLECRPTKFNDVPKETIQVRPLYLVIANRVDDVPGASGYERRRVILNDYLTAMRNRYPEIRAYMEKAHDRYLMMRAKGEA
ncbi:MAG: hypothetical protein LC118_11460 [Dehalococcoidia bacterium]|nr:hypothetical protein [Dehalococcoidia bacterium]